MGIRYRNIYSAIHPSGRCFAYAQHDGKQSRHVIASETKQSRRLEYGRLYSRSAFYCGVNVALKLSAEFCRHVVKIVIDVLFHGERFGYIEVDRLLTVASDNAVGFTFH